MRYNHKSKVLAYADDVVIVTPQPEQAMRAIDEEARKYGLLSSYALNRDKTQIVVNEFITFNDSQVVKKANYLRVKINSDLDQAVKEHCESCMVETRKALKKRDHLHLTLIGRTNTIKMIYFPKSLYYFRAIPLAFTNFWFKKFETIFAQFIWSYSRPRRAFKLITTQGVGRLCPP